MVFFPKVDGVLGIWDSRSGFQKRLFFLFRLLDQRLKNLKSSLLAAKKSLQDEGLQTDRDDVILIDSPEPSESRKLILKIRCRTDLHRIPVRMVRLQYVCFFHLSEGAVLFEAQFIRTLFPES